MTLILGLAAVDGIVLASDGQVTTGEVRSPGKKIFPLSNSILWAAAGELSLIQRVQERLTALPLDASLANLRDQIGELIKNCVSELLQMDFRSQFLTLDQDRLIQLHNAEFIFAEYSRKPELLHLSVFGSPEWITQRPFVAGNGDLFAYALLSKYQPQHLKLEQATLLAYKVVEEAIEVGAYGIGGPIDLWQLSAAGVKKLSTAELHNLAAHARKLRKQEIELLQNLAPETIAPGR
ncbi:hypothetical protein [Desulfobacca acetoxidans]|nr:hypothetical protein [Desulfobacterales bacterium]